MLLLHESNHVFHIQGKHIGQKDLLCTKMYMDSAHAARVKPSLNPKSLDEESLTL